MSMRFWINIFLCITLFILSGKTFCQTKTPFYLHIFPVDSVQKFPSIQQNFTNKKEITTYVFRLKDQLSLQGYVTNSIDSIWEKGDTTNILLFLGEKYVWKNIKINSRDSGFLSMLGYNKNNFHNTHFQSVQKLQDSILNYFNNTGHPFANIKMDSIEIINNEISGTLVINPSGLYTIDSIVQNGNAKLTQNYLHRYLEIGKHEPYNASKLATISNKLQNLPYVNQSQPWNVKMTSTGALLDLYLEPKQVNQIDAIVGFLPANGDLGGKLLLRGQVNVDLKNAFAAGEELKLSWQQLQSRSPRINIGFNRPYIFNSPYGIDFDFELYKRDSLFLNVFAHLGVQYAISSQQSAGVFFQFASTRALNIDTALVIATKSLPNIMDVSTTSIGFQYQINTTNYRLNPRRGNEFYFSGMAGSRSIGKNNTISQLNYNGFNYESLYDTVKLKSYQCRIVTSGAHYFPVGKQSVLKLGGNVGIYQSPNTYVNELFQIGGYKLLRGFNEESIYTNRYAVGTAEYRYLIGQNAYFFGFSDIGYAKYDVSKVRFGHTYIGLGVGMALQTKAGILNLSYAVGKRDDTKLDMQQAKIHIGFVSLF